MVCQALLEPLPPAERCNPNPVCRSLFKDTMCKYIYSQSSPDGPYKQQGSHACTRCRLLGRGDTQQGRHRVCPWQSAECNEMHSGRFTKLCVCQPHPEPLTPVGGCETGIYCPAHVHDELSSPSNDNIKTMLSCSAAPAKKCSGSQNAAASCGGHL